MIVQDKCHTKYLSVENIWKTVYTNYVDKY